MNVTMIDHTTFAETIAECEILSTVDGPGAGQTYIAVRDGADILVITDGMNGGAVVIQYAFCPSGTVLKFSMVIGQVCGA